MATSVRPFSAGSVTKVVQSHRNVGDGIMRDEKCLLARWTTLRCPPRSHFLLPMMITHVRASVK
jgi:hypothetical protein